MQTTEPTAGETHSEDDPRRSLSRILVAVSAAAFSLMLLAAGVLVWRSQRETLASLPRGSAKADTPGPATPLKPAAAEAKPASDIWGTVQDFELTERSGRTVSNKDLLGQPWIAGFIFTHCAGQCPRISAEMKKLQDRLQGQPVRLVSISVDPKRDTPERLRDYAKAFGADEEQWLFLTGDQQEIYGLIQRSFKMPVKEMVGPDRKPGFEVLHTSNVIYVDAAGRIRGKYNTLSEVEMAELIGALETEAAALSQGGKP